MNFQVINMLSEKKYCNSPKNLRDFPDNDFFLIVGVSTDETWFVEGNEPHNGFGCEAEAYWFRFRF